MLVAQEGSVSAAANRLNLTQAAVSQAITVLEQALDVKLLDRSVRPPLLTLRGSTALQYAREILAKVHEFEDAMRYSGSGRVPLLRIGMLNSFASTAGAFVLNQLRDIAAEWTVASGFRETCIQALLDRQSDVIITTDETPAPSEIEVFPIFSEPFVAVVPASFDGKTERLQDIADKLDFIHYGHDSHMGSKITNYLKKIGTVPARRYQFDTTDAALHMVAGGFGWAIVTPLIYLKSRVEGSGVRVVPLTRLPIHRTFIVGMRRGEGSDIAQRVRTAAIITLRDVILPQIEAVLPEASKGVSVAEIEPKASTGKRKGSRRDSAGS
ncbi:bacterial regulatory helix-turn-helix, lysR family protein [Paraburkholderia xenovorans LB400]|nr:bacterial regulatory helix-turn-helix, lysR family protein [Paraburkholderia xenovorans LB400]